jgi:hypothetical protein
MQYGAPDQSGGVLDCLCCVGPIRWLSRTSLQGGCKWAIWRLARRTGLVAHWTVWQDSLVGFLQRLCDVAVVRWSPDLHYRRFNAPHKLEWSPATVRLDGLVVHQIDTVGSGASPDSAVSAPLLQRLFVAIGDIKTPKPAHWRHKSYTKPSTFKATFPTHSKPHKRHIRKRHIRSIQVWGT